MNTFNRALIVTLLLVAIVLCSLFLIVPAALDQLAQQLVALGQYLSTLRWGVRIALGILFAVALDIILVLLIILEVRRFRPASIRVEKVTGGEVRVSVASIADRLRYEIDQLPGILRVKPKVSARGGGVVLALEVQGAPPMDVPQKAERIVETARLVVEEKLGLKLARPPKVELRTVPYPRVQPMVPPERRREAPFLPGEEGSKQDAGGQHDLGSIG